MFLNSVLRDRAYRRGENYGRGGGRINQLFKTKNIDIFVNIYVYMYIYVCRGENLNLRKYVLNKNTRISMVGPIRLVDYFFTAPGSLRLRVRLFHVL